VNDEPIVHPIVSRSAVFSILIAVSVVVLIGISVAFLVGIALITGQPRTVDFAILSTVILTGVAAVAFLLSLSGVFLGWTAYRNSEGVRLMPVLGLVFNGMVLIAIVLVALWVILGMLIR